MTNDWLFQDCSPPDARIQKSAMTRQGQLTKPPGALGQLEQLAIQLAAMQGSEAPSAEHVDIVIFAADHGVAEEGISAFPQAVTCEMIKNFMQGGAAISVLARELGARLSIVNAGVASEQSFAGVVDQPVAPGTQNFANTAAMSMPQLIAALRLGRAQIDRLGEPRVDLVIGGEMGIGNTSSATALAAILLGRPPATLIGPGTGLDAAGIRHKLSVIERAIARLDDELETLEILRQLGGFEIAALAGYYIRAAQQGMPIVVDGFIATVAALVACQLNTGVRAWMIFSHASAEPGHQLLLEALQATAMIDMGLRLGEGSGAALAVSVLRSACALHNNMATFAEASVSQKRDVSAD